MNNNTMPITEAGIGIGEMNAKPLAINIIMAKTAACCKNEYTFFSILLRSLLSVFYGLSI